MRPERDENGKFPAYAWPGGYPILYLTADNSVLCPACANRENGSEAFLPERGKPLLREDQQWALEALDVYYEGQPVACDHCGAEIASAYGDPESEDE